MRRLVLLVHVLALAGAGFHLLRFERTPGPQLAGRFETRTLEHQGRERSFDLHAERHGFLAVYPDGFEQHWSGCRARGPYAANEFDVDDVGFLDALVDHLVGEHSAYRARVFATGLSNGVYMALRLALEAPDFVHAIAHPSPRPTSTLPSASGRSSRRLPESLDAGPSRRVRADLPFIRPTPGRVDHA